MDPWGKNASFRRKLKSPGLVEIRMATMKVSDYMVQLHKRLMEERKVSESTATQYLQTLFKLNGSKPFNNLAWLRKYDTVQAEIDKYAVSTQANQYAVLSSVLFFYNDKSTYKAAYNHWRQKLKQAMDEKDAKDYASKNILLNIKKYCERIT
jgi:hypothetical protein